MRQGIELILLERLEQIEKHGRTVERDRTVNEDQQLRIAAMKLLIKADGFDDTEAERRTPPKGWDKAVWRKMITKGYKERMIMAAALLAAEVDRIN